MNIFGISVDDGQGDDAWDAVGGIAVSTGDDVRYLWLAGAAMLGSMLAVPRGRGASGPPHVSIGRALGAVAAGSACAAVTAVFLMGATVGPGVAIVATAFGLCTGVSAVLAALARRPRT